MKKWYKIISVISAIAMLLSCFGGISIVSAEGTEPMPDFQALIEQKISLSNETTEDDILAILEEIDEELYDQDSEYIVNFEEIGNFYKIDAVGGAYEIGSANGGSGYTGAPVNDEVLVEGIDGYISFVLGYSDPDGEEYKTVITLKIEAPMEGYKFASCSNDINHWQKDANGAYKYAKSGVEKLVIPDEITKLENHWHGYQSKIKCVVFGSGVTTVQQAKWYNNYGLEVVVLSDEVTTIGSAAFWQANKLKYIRIPDTLKNIYGKAFKECASLTHLELPYGLNFIGSHVLAESGIAASTVHNFKKLTIPATVTKIDVDAFNGAVNPFEITLLGTYTSGISSTAFYNSTIDANATYAATANYQNNNVRFWKSIDSSIVTKSETNRSYLDDMTITEVAARAAREAKKLTGKIYSDADTAVAATETILTRIKAAYGNSAAYTAEWQNAEWNIGVIGISNILTITNGTDTANIEVVVPFAYNGGLNKEITVTNDTTEATFKAQLEDATDCKIEITDFYKIKSMPEVVEVGSTYEGAIEGEILVPGEMGYVSAYYTLTDNGGNTQSGNIVVDIKPERVEKTYRTVSKNSDFVETSEGSGIWEYKSEKDVDKVVVPDFVTKLKSNTDLYTNWYNNKWFDCVVFGTGITELPRGAELNAEVVSFKGNNVKTLNAASFYKAKNLKYIHLPESVETIGNRAFANCTSLEYLYLPEGLTTIGQQIFYAPNHDNINCDANNAWANANVGTLNKEKGYKISEITIPSTVTSIGDMAFSGASVDCVITFLTKALVDSNNINIVVVSGADASMTEHTWIRAWKGTKASRFMNYKNAEDTVERLELLDTGMGLAEIKARAKQAADRYTKEFYSSLDDVTAKTESILASVKNAYNNTNWTATWENAEWFEKQGISYSNTVVITVDGSKVEIPVTLFADTGFYADGAEILDTAEWTENNNKQCLRFFNTYRSNSAGTIIVDGVEYEIKDFGIIIKHIANDSETAAKSTLDDVNFEIDSIGVTKESGLEGTVTRDEETGYNEFSVLIKNIPQGGRDYYFQSRGYITYEADGKEITIYSGSQVTSAKAQYDKVSAETDYVGMADWFAGIIN